MRQKRISNKMKRERRKKENFVSLKADNYHWCPACNKCKFGYETEAKAKRALEYTQKDYIKTNKHKSVPVRYYKCPEWPKGCGKWHLTSQK